MKTGPDKTPAAVNRTYSVEIFVRRVVITLAALIAVSSAVVVLLVYLPLKTELEKSLIDNFSQLSFIRYHSLQNNMDRGLEGARSLSSRTMIKNALLEYKGGEIDLDMLMAYTQPKYEDGAKALEYLALAERRVDDTFIARYAAAGNKALPCTVADSLAKSDSISSTLCLVDGDTYFTIQSPILSGDQVLGYDRLIFDLTSQIEMLCTDTIKSELFYPDEFQDLLFGSAMIQDGGTSSIAYRGGFYYHAIAMQDGVYFVSKENQDSLLDSVYRLSRQILMVGIGSLLIFTASIYFFVIRFAKNELVDLEDSRSALKKAASEANIDSLTKVGNRRYGEESLTLLFEHFQNGKESPAILLFDIDSLKKINDTYGHSVGDKVIHSIAKAVRENIRSEDILFRWGGDEFVAILQRLPKEKAMLFAQKLLNTVSSVTVETEAGTIQPTISIGISYFRKEDFGFLDAMNRADCAMYQSKAEGRNRANE